jgi:hypothetical protein
MPSKKFPPIPTTTASNAAYGGDKANHRAEEPTVMTAAAASQPSEHRLEADIDKVTDMLDALAAGDVQLTITGLEDLLGRLRTAAAARQFLADVDRNTLKAALLRRRQRAEGGPQR